MAGLDLASEVTCDAAMKRRTATTRRERLRVVALDFGIKRSIVRYLARARLRRHASCRRRRAPATCSSSSPDGVFLSNGPGDPAAVTYAVKTVRELLGKVPVFGICLGHQLLGLALGLATYKLPFGHRGANHPVKDLRTGVIEITTQNHGFAVRDRRRRPRDGAEVTHVNL